MTQVPKQVDDGPGVPPSNPFDPPGTPETTAKTRKPRNGNGSKPSPTKSANAHAADRHAANNVHPIDRAKEAGMANPGQSKPTDSTPDVLSPFMSGASSAAMAAASAAVRPPEPADEAPATIARPSSFSLDKFRTKTADNIGEVATLLTALPHHKLSDAKDFVRLHPGEQTYWSPELCFVNVPIKGMKRDTLHLIEEEIATRYLPAGRILRFRLVLATKPYDVFFLCHVPTRNTDNDWNSSNLQACEQAKTLWVQATSRKGENVDGYKIEFAHDVDAFPPPRWPSQSLEALIEVTFAGRMIMSVDHPALLRLIGAKPRES